MRDQLFHHRIHLSCNNRCTCILLVHLHVLTTELFRIIKSAEALSILRVRCAQWEREREREKEIERERYRERERERERERRKWRHHCRAKIGDELTRSLAKNLHFLFLPSHFPSPFLTGHHCGAEIRNEFTLSVAKKIRPLCSDSLRWCKPRDGWSKTQDKWSNPSQSYIVLLIEKMNQINTQNYWK